MVHRIEVRTRPGHANPKAENAGRSAAALGFDAGRVRVEHADVYLIEGDFDADDIERIASELLADTVTQTAHIGALDPLGSAYIEVQPLPGVMDPAADSIRLAIRALVDKDVQVRTGERFDFFDLDQQVADDIAARALANTVIHAVHTEPFVPEHLPTGAPHPFRIVDVPIRHLDDDALNRLSRDAHLFLSLTEMQAIRAEYKRLGREPRDIELETLAQTWSEHCVHKTLKSTIRYKDNRGSIDFSNRPGHEINPDGSVTIHNLLKSTVAAATHDLMADGIDWCLSVFVDNAGVIAFDDEWAVCFKCETHNHPSAIEPYGGAATGIGGCIRDIIGTGLAAKPIASTDVFCVAYPDHWAGRNGRAVERTARLPQGVLHPRRVLQQVVAGVRDYGNRMGIPTVNGAVWFNDRYIGNPLVYCGCIGVMPRAMITGKAQPGDRIIAVGGRTGRDGIHGATFSSAELTDTHADEFSHAVQIGNAVTEKMLLDAILEARDAPGGPLYHAITDCGAGGFSSAVGEMGEELGAWVRLENAPLKYEGLTPTEIWISEAQERMVLAVPEKNLPALRAVCNTHNVELCDLGYFGVRGRELVLTYNNTELGRLSMEFLHEGLPRTTREAADGTVKSPQRRITQSKPGSIEDALCALLAHPNIASKHWIVRQYDHEVQGNTAVKPLVGPHGIGPGDAAVITPVSGSTKGLAIANGLATGFSDDPYVMTLAAIDECVRNLVCVGADPSRIAILDNFCWPSCNTPENLGSLVRAAEACYDGAKAYRTPFISGKDSLNNQFTTEDGETIEIPPTLLISGIGIVPDVRRCVTMDAKRPGNRLVLIGPTQVTRRGSHYDLLFGGGDDDRPHHVDLDFGPRAARLVHRLIGAGIALSAHDGSEGGLLVAAAEMCIAGGLGLDLSGLADYLAQVAIDPYKACFAECASAYLLEVADDDDTMRRIEEHLRACGLRDDAMAPIGTFNDSGRLTLAPHVDVAVTDLRRAWRKTLDW